MFSSYFDESCPPSRTRQPSLPVIGIVLLAVLSWMGAAKGNPLVSLDLASETESKLSVDGGQSRAIKVPFWGWNSDRQSPRISETTDVKDHVVYSRSIQIPAEAEGQVTKLVFGAVNYGADILLDGRLPPVSRIRQSESHLFQE